MTRVHALRSSILAALGASGSLGAMAGCAAAASGDGTPVVTIARPTGSGPLAPIDSAEPEKAHRPLQRGWVTAADHTAHRVSRTTCDPGNDAKACAGTEPHRSCEADADCKAGPHGKCVSGMGMIGPFCGCEYACESDGDCGDAQVCVCKGTGEMTARRSMCVKASCSTDADCKEGTCSLAEYQSGCMEELEVACRTGDDACRSNADCGIRGGCYPALGKPRPARWECATWSCVPGRPLVIAGEMKVAPALVSRAWAGGSIDLDTLDLGALDPLARAALAAHHARQAALEHASVASFARVSLQLLALGAPADLLAETHRAALDEVEHARSMYALAARLAGQAMGPGPLPEATAPLGTELFAIVEALVLEGCVGETAGAAEVREMARLAGEPALRALFSSIAADEERHAALAWKTLRWLLDRSGAEARAVAERVFHRVLLEPMDHTVDDGPAHEAFGALSAETRASIHREVLAEVVRPCWDRVRAS